MPPSRAEVRAALQRAEAKVQSINTALLDTMAVKADDLTGHPGWDLFLQRCQALKEQAQKELAEWTTRTCDAYKGEDMRLAQRQVAAYKAQVQTLDTVMGWPKEIVTEHAAQSR
jgi:hypothetical protein